VGLKDLNLKPVYYSDEDDLLRDFYIPVLSNSVKYDRIAGYFSSNALAIAVKGIARFVESGGKIRMIANVVLSQNDQDAIKAALLEKENEVLAEIINLEDELKKDHIRMLSWMVKNTLLEIKIAVVKNGVEHQKTGILEDSDGNIVSFSGSDNETVKGWLYNDEQFHAFCSWKEGDRDHLFPDIERFCCLWENRGKKVRVYAVSDAFRRGLICTAPDNDEEFKKLSQRTIEELLLRQTENLQKKRKDNNIKLRDYQEKAIANWLDSNCNGILEMATGTGKTFTALGCVKHQLDTGKKLAIVITSPYGHLSQQWQKEIEAFGLRFDRLVVADSANSKWRDVLSDSLIDLTLGYSENLAVLTTHNTFSSEDFGSIFEKNKKAFQITLLADEVHRLGAEKSRKGLLELYDFRLALSATPKRWFDDDGTRAIFDYFGDVVFEFSLEQAINSVNPDTMQTYLTPYRYIPKFIPLNEEELDEYVRLTRSIVSKLSKSKTDSDYNEQVDILRFIRANVIKNASAKYQGLETLLDAEKEEVRWVIIYCTPEQIDQVMSIVNRRRIVAHRFTMDEKVRPEAKYEGLSERVFILKKFAETEYQALVAMKCLDEGVDVPQARTGILMASSGNPREYIQRIGRVIRRYKDKEVATIYDFVVVPSLVNLPPELKRVEYNIFSKELARYEEVARIAVNNAEVLAEIYDLRRKLYG